MKDAQEMIPDQESGIQSNTEKTIELSNEKEAIEFYYHVRNRLLNVNDWQRLAGPASANFQLTDEEGKNVNRPAKEKDFFKIDIPAPKSITGEGNDWVQIEAIEETNTEEKQSIVILVRPTSNPLNKQNDIAHFFSDESTSSFSIKREKNTVTAGIYGRNEKPNRETERIVDKIRNTAVATVAISGFSKLQWKSLVNGLLAR